MIKTLERAISEIILEASATFLKSLIIQRMMQSEIIILLLNG
jgi:hypothetical protein